MKDTVRRRGSSSREFRILRDDDGECRRIQSVETALPTEGADIEWLVGTNLDITERKQTEAEIRQLNEELEQRVQQRTLELEAANRELEAFSYSVAHDLRAPLRTIDGFSQVVLNDYSEKLDAEGQEYLRLVRAGCQRMSQLIDDLLQLSRLARAPMSHEAVDLTEMAREIIFDLRTRDPKRVVRCEIAAGLVTVGTPSLLQAAVRNLIENAWKFTGQRAEAIIEIGQMPEDSKANSAPIYFIRDNGTGFDMQYAGKLFEVFKRLHRQNEFTGTGIGLATARRILQRHGGRIWVEAAVDQGATFYFTIN